MVHLQGGKEYFGAILGKADEPQTEVEGPAVTGNFYPLLGADPGAIDGISYDTVAQSRKLEEFLESPQTPDLFKSVTITFRQEDGTNVEVKLTPGQALPESKIPALPQKTGCTASWEGLQDTDLGYVIHDMTFDALYTPHNGAIQSQQLRDGTPLLLAEGDFPDGSVLTAEEGNAGSYLETWYLTVPEGTTKLRLRLPRDMAAEDMKLLTDASGTWEEVPFTGDGSYLVFDAEPGTYSCALAQSDSISPLWLVLPALLILAAALFLINRRKKATA